MGSGVLQAFDTAYSKAVRLIDTTAVQWDPTSEVTRDTRGCSYNMAARGFKLIKSLKQRVQKDRALTAVHAFSTLSSC